MVLGYGVPDVFYFHHVDLSLRVTPYTSRERRSWQWQNPALCDKPGLVVARKKILDWWQRKGCTLLDIYADRFAERSNVTGKLIWDQVPQRLVIRGVLDQQAGG